MVLGSMARREPLPASDVDTAVLWSTLDGRTEGRTDGRSDGHHDSEGVSDSDRADRIRGNARTVLDRMERCGLRWIGNPTSDGALLLSCVIADSRPITRPTLGRAITDTLAATTQSLDFRDGLLRFATASQPPVGFVRDFVVEHSGEYRGGFDLKRGGLLPVTALARWRRLDLGDPGRARSAGPSASARVLPRGVHDSDHRAPHLAAAAHDPSVSP